MTQTYIYYVIQRTIIKVIQIKPDQIRIKINRKTANRLNDLKGDRTDRQKGQWHRESFDALLQRLLTLVETATKIKKELNKS